MKIQDISNSEDKPLSSNKLSNQDLCTYIEGCRSLDNFQNCSESFTPLLSRLSRDAQTTQELSMFVLIRSSSGQSSRTKFYRKRREELHYKGSMECFLNKTMPKNLAKKNQNFFFKFNLKGDHSIKNAFWADARSRTAYEYFGDVVSFDTTYNTNRYNLVFGSFVGVNHHGQSTLLGCALMKNEDIQSFKWLFDC
ncbi:hypothetical protein Ahy_B04g071503 isoform B [Arachis hypogaea]|uniref:MULE transposase domain-containing protein n=1 Tax=Arachis hypogaea TaxID=3818 RepID=A0A444ZKW1_ARAHY|nr:hypothetical protein Ahy_B04g071503 isoform B [Arachis hypogaea]